MDFRRIFFGMFLFLGLSFFDSKAMAPVDIVRKLTTQGKLPGKGTDYNGIMPNQLDALVDRVVNVFSSAHGFLKRNVLPGFLGGTNRNLLQSDLTLVLPSEIRDRVKIQYWIRTGKILSQIPIEDLKVLDLEQLVARGRIPNVPVHAMKLRNMAKYYVDHYAQAGVFCGMGVVDTHNKMSSWLKFLPVEFQNEVKKYYHCAMLRKNENIWLDGEIIDVATSYFVECGVLPLPAGTNINQLKALENNNQIDHEAYIYADFINRLDNQGRDTAQLRTVVSNIRYFLPITFSNNVIVQYSMLTDFNGRLLSDKKFFGGIDWSISLANLLRIPGFANRTNQKIAESHTLDLSNKRIDSITTDDLRHFNLDAIHTLIISGNKFKELPANLFIDFANLKAIIISNNSNLTEMGLPLLGGLNVKSIDLSGNNLKTLPNRMFKTKVNAAGQIVAAEGATNSVAELNLSNNPISFNSNTNFVEGLYEALSSLKELRVLDLSNTNISTIQDILHCKLIKLEYLILSNNSMIKTLASNLPNNNGIAPQANGGLVAIATNIGTSNEFTMPNLHTLDLCNSAIESVDKTSFKAFPNLKRLNLTGNKLTSFGEPVGTAQITTGVAPAGSAFSCLHELEELYLGRNGIWHLTEDSFRDLSNLKLLCLDGNFITKIASQTFKTNTKLEALYLFANNLKLPLAGSPTTTIEDNAFFGLGNLKYLDLSYNRIEKLGVKSFTDLNDLTHLNLSYNSLSKANYPVFSNLTKLQFFDLAFNWMHELDMCVINALKSCKKINIRGNFVTGFAKPISWLALINKANLSIAAGTRAEIDIEWSKKYIPDLERIWRKTKDGVRSTFRIARKIPTHEIVRNWSTVANPNSISNIEDYYIKLRESYKRAFFDKTNIMKTTVIRNVTQA